MQWPMLMWRLTNTTESGAKENAMKLTIGEVIEAGIMGLCVTAILLWVIDAMLGIITKGW